MCLVSARISPRFVQFSAKQAFNHLGWEYLWMTIHRFGLGPHFIKIIKVIYGNPSARIITGNIFTSSFYITRGPRQGCVLSPLLCALLLEPLPQMRRQHPLDPLHTWAWIYFCHGTLLQLINFQGVLRRVEVDIKKSLHPITLLDKMDTLLRGNFYSNVLPLPSPRVIGIRCAVLFLASFGKANNLSLS